MNTTDSVKSAPQAGVPAQVAKAALRRLAQAQLEPTPAHYAQAYDDELGVAPRPVLPGRAQPVLERLCALLLREEEPRRALLQAFAKGQWSAVERQIEQAQQAEAGHSRALSELIERLVRGLERTDRQWTRARKKESLQTVLEGSRADAHRLRHRLTQLVASWESDAVADAAKTAVDEKPADSAGAGDQLVASTGEEQSAGPVPGLADPAALPAGAGPAAAAEAPGTSDDPPDAALGEPGAADEPSAPAAAGASSVAGEPQAPTAIAASVGAGDATLAVPSLQAAPQADAWSQLVALLGGTLGRALPADDARSAPLAANLDTLAAAVRTHGPTDRLAAAWAEDCGAASRLLERRDQLLLQMRSLCEELTAGLTDLAEDDSWARGQCEAMRAKLDEGLSARGLRSIGALLHDTRTRQRGLRQEREQARDALKHLIQQMLQEVGELDSQTDRFEASVGRYAEVIESADTLESLTGVVRELVAESRTVQQIVSQSRQRLADEHAHAEGLADKVQRLEGELRRLSDEVSTDQLTQVANRRGLIKAFDTECARLERGGGAPLTLGLIDVDNFKRLNDDLGHNAGDEALKALAERVRQLLRPMDMVARYGGEEFVVMLPETDVEEGRQVLSRMQRAMTQALFMHESRPIFVTFSAGVTAYRAGERLEQSLERADEALYEAKRTGKNRTCAA